MSLHYNVVSPLLLEILHKMMSHSAFNDYVLVGGTALALHLGHRESVDIDMFSAKMYGSSDTLQIKNVLQEMFEYTDRIDTLNESSMVYQIYVGHNSERIIKVDLCYTDEFIRPILHSDGIRLASLEDIAGMKIAAITSRKERKDFWDIHELLLHFSFAEIINFGLERNSYSLTEENILKAFSEMDVIHEQHPINCFKGKYWEVIVMDLYDEVVKYKQNSISEAK
jgi:predicted nucleotidyltransferase component of viral defense system